MQTESDEFILADVTIDRVTKDLSLVVKGPQYGFGE